MLRVIFWASCFCLFPIALLAQAKASLKDCRTVQGQLSLLPQKVDLHCQVHLEQQVIKGVWKKVAQQASFDQQAQFEQLDKGYYRLGFVPIQQQKNDLWVSNTVELPGLANCLEQEVLLSTDNSVLERAIQVFPNPASRQLSISNPDQKNLVAIWYDYSGQLVKTFSIQEVHTFFHLMDYPPGIYFLYLRDEQGQSLVQKVLVQ
ncbi:MAG: T9SS type A sorting domain-containing protein [Bacteroidota bacterium]